MNTQAERINFVLSLEKTKSTWRKKHSSAEFKAASDLNNELFGIHLNKSKKCKCVEDLFFMLSRLNVEKLNLINQIKMNKFILKKGKVIMLHAMTTILTEKNMTDEKAIELLKSHKGHIKNFEKFPEDWESIVFGTAKPAAKKEEPKKEEHKEEVKKEEIPVVVSKTEIKNRAKAVGLPKNATLQEVIAAETKKK